MRSEHCAPTKKKLYNHNAIGKRELKISTSNLGRILTQEFWISYEASQLTEPAFSKMALFWYFSSSNEQSPQMHRKSNKGENSAECVEKLVSASDINVLSHTVDCSKKFYGMS